MEKCSKPGEKVDAVENLQIHVGRNYLIIFNLGWNHVKYVLVKGLFKANFEIWIYYHLSGLNEINAKHSLGLV